MGAVAMNPKSVLRSPNSWSFPSTITRLWLGVLLNPAVQRHVAHVAVIAQQRLVAIDVEERQVVRVAVAAGRVEGEGQRIGGLPGAVPEYGGLPGRIADLVLAAGYLRCSVPRPSG